MKVQEIIALLQQCDPEAEVIFNAPYQGFEAITVLLRREAPGGIALNGVPTVEVTNGDLAHMRGQGMDFLGLGDPAPCPCNTCREYQAQ